jgi:lactoylglutathione lyase
MNTKLTYVIKYVADMDRAIAFYEKELGLTLRFQSPYWTEFDTGSTTLALHAANAEHPAGTAGLGFGVPNVDEFYTTKSGNGIEFVSPPTPQFGANIAKFKDADGAECSVSSPENQ